MPSGGSYQYRSGFFDFVDVSSGRSATRFLERLDLGFHPRHVLDVGCGRGVWLHAWKRRGVTEVQGVDGSYVDPGTLHIGRDEFVAADIAQPLRLERSFDLVQCLEVAEHVPEESSGVLLANLVGHGDVVLFSAAIPGQGGEQHVNERPLAYWVERFAKLGFEAFDYPRASVRGLREIEPWYRYNSMLFANSAGQARLAPAVLDTRLRPGEVPREMGSPTWRLRCRLLRLAPRSLVNRLAQVKHGWTTRWGRTTAGRGRADADSTDERGSRV
jgi:SAM-dependent methyltransferase